MVGTLLSSISVSLAGRILEWTVEVRLFLKLTVRQLFCFPFHFYPQFKRHLVPPVWVFWECLWNKSSWSCFLHGGWWFSFSRSWITCFFCFVGSKILFLFTSFHFPLSLRAVKVFWKFLLLLLFSISRASRCECMCSICHF